jgi:hypothetical protein
MTGPDTGTQIDPFEDTVVREPREVTFSVKGLNDAPLDWLLTQFASSGCRRVAAQPAGQNQKSPARGVA